MHSYCRRSSDTLPTRLISISQKPWEKNPSLRLRNSDDILPGSIYTTLSHCWGSNPDMFGIVTTNSNIHQMMSSIPWDQLSKTFQDAIRITLKLDIMYPWIDSLCIIQGSQDDWEREAGQMESVYRNSYLNIAATGASNGSTGCFFERSALLSRSEEATFSVNRGDEPFPRFPRVNLLVAGMVERFKREPLNQRGWVIQERLLSPRVLHFARDQMVWESNYMEALEGGPRMHERIQFKSKHWRIRWSKSDNDPRSGPSNGTWWDIVESYTAASLTKPTDRLVAILGVAAYIKQNYCWGIREESMHHDLLWSRALDTQKSAMSRHNKSIAPSWSWASMDGTSVRRPQVLSKPTGGAGGEAVRWSWIYCTITVLQTSRHQYLVGDKFDAEALNTNGELHLKCFLAPVLINNLDTCRDANGAVKGGLLQDCIQLIGERKQNWSLLRGSWLCLDDVRHEVRRTRDPEKVNTFLLPIRFLEQTTWKCIHGLLVEEHDTDRARFHRIGVFSILEELGPEKLKPKKAVPGRLQSRSSDGLFKNIGCFWDCCSQHAKVRKGGEKAGDMKLMEYRNLDPEMDVKVSSREETGLPSPADTQYTVILV